MDNHVYQPILAILFFLTKNPLRVEHFEKQESMVEDETCLSKNQILEILYKLEQYGYVLRVYEKRCTSYHITKKGHELTGRLKKNLKWPITNRKG
ncbi:DUF3116 family protein [Listeria sp. PSOL-1]|uniref:DUF3116 family protein n=1 Tax=Listeria sp. PSOL-1 TaxID=1844999 RepID=UPI0013D5B2C2|nr:DUF3116 family protein [Listeria sp. PSOL-1]